MLSELRVPTVAMTAEVTCLDGRSFRGRIFVPASASTHEGPMHAQEWMNTAGQFFPFLPDDADTPVLLNKMDVLMLSLPGEADRPALPGVGIERRVRVECGQRQLEGRVHIDMPAHASRVLDYLNCGEAFMALHDAGRVYLVQKHNVTRVIEVRET